MKRVLSVSAAAVAALVLTASPALADSHVPSDTIADGLITPLSLAAGPHGTTFVSQNFVGLLTAVDEDGSTMDLYSSGGAEVGGVSYRNRTVTFTQTGETQTVMTQRLNSKGGPAGDPKVLADVGAYEESENPDGGVVYGFRDTPEDCVALLPPDFPGRYTGIVDSHPYSTTTRGATTYLADAGANAILGISRQGDIRTVAVLPPMPTTLTEEIVEAQGLPDCFVGETYWFEPVPTDVEFGPRGVLYVSLLPGGPEDDSLGARGAVVTVNPRTGAVALVASGFFGATGVSVDGQGTVYVAEMFGGQITMVERDGTRSALDTVPLPGDVDVTQHGLLATVNVLPGDGVPPDGQLVKYTFTPGLQ
ncbi:ScyD/ScyE family protein [Isoptericola sp. 178]|uniref:ScyD/ScyE family protein n=1 Tax=Isoptericola sp. 178 TaxID=3064651 RepID=UPI002713E274|nr:ScyD/ScyE family protein [Isoptericola sp. 178]MDO8143636.1 ScyD/ScyE family protein [Isoptericola sp. 178]